MDNNIITTNKSALEEDVMYYTENLADTAKEIDIMCQCGSYDKVLEYLDELEDYVKGVRKYTKLIIKVKEELK